MSFIHEDFLLESQTARRLYHEYAEAEPILDYHCHLDAHDLACNRKFSNLHEIWLEGDHYKWRAMRANGVDERLITGDATPKEKFLAWAETVPRTLRNPLYHWTHLELKRYFGIDELLSLATAESIWQRANEQLQGGLTAQEILRRFKVRLLCTTDDPTDSLEDHKRLRASPLETQVLPAFRPDKALKIADPAAFNLWTAKLGESAALPVHNFEDFLEALARRQQYFHEQGCRLADHALTQAPGEECIRTEAAAIFAAVHRGERPTALECEKFAGFLLLYLGELYVASGWCSQLHLGPLRDVNTEALRRLGPDTGFDSIGDFAQGERLGHLLNRMENSGALPPTILYDINPSDNYLLATMTGNFGKSGVPGRMQFGSGWWFMDQKEGIEWQLNALSNEGLLSRFVGMLTDSRSFLSYTRHEYFRRVLCNLLGGEMERGLLPDDTAMVGSMIRDICYANARDYFGFPPR
jgi:glucuronate isomerase